MMRMQRKQVLALAAAVLAGVAAWQVLRAPGPGAFGEALAMTDDAARLAGNWRVIEVQDAPIPEGAVPRLVFEPARLAGFTGCNEFGAPLTYGAEGAIRLGEAVATRRLCGPASMTLETQMLYALRVLNAVTFETEDRIALVAYGSVMMRAERMR